MAVASSGVLMVGAAISRQVTSAVAPKPAATDCATARIRSSSTRIVSTRKARTVPFSATLSGMTL